MEIETLLSITALGQIETLKIILPKLGELPKSKKTDLNRHDKYGNFLAIAAAKQNNLEMLKLFVKYGAGPSLNLECKNGNGTTVMGWAKKHKNEIMIKYIEEVNEEIKNIDIMLKEYGFDYHSYTLEEPNYISPKEKLLLLKKEREIEMKKYIGKDMAQYLGGFY